MRWKLGIYLSLALAFSASGANATTVLIDAYSFDLNQFDGAVVTTNASSSNSNEVDQLMGIDPYSTGDLVNAATGDILNLGNSTRQEWLKYTYGTGFYVGSGMSSLFVVYENSSSTTVSDIEGTAFQIRFSTVGNTWAAEQGWVNASNNISLKLLNFDTPQSSGNPHQNQIVFDLTSAVFGFDIGDQIDRVEIRNIMGLGDSSDPDFTFAAHAGTSTPPVVPVPAPLALGVVGIAMVSAAKLRRNAAAD